MQEYDDFKDLSFTSLVNTNYTKGGTSTIQTYEGNPQTGSSLRGTVVPFNTGEFSVRLFRQGYPLSISMSADNAIIYKHYAKSILNGQKILSGTYVLIQTQISGTKFERNDDNLPINNNDNIELLYPQGDKGLVNYGYQSHPYFKVIRFNQDFEPTIKVDTNFSLMDGRKLPDYVADFGKLSYTAGSEQDKADSFLATTVYSSADIKPVMYKNIYEYETSGDWLVKDDLTYYEDGSSEYPNTAGVYLCITWNKSTNTGIANKSNFSITTVSLPEASSSGMDFLPANRELLGFETNGQINSAGIYLKRIQDFTKHGYTTGYNDVDKFSFVPDKRPFTSNLIHSITYARFSEGTVLVYGNNSFEWKLSFTLGGGLPDFPDWSDTSSGLKPKLAFFQLIQTPEVLSGGYPLDSYKCNLTFGMSDGSVVTDYLSNSHNWCMINLNGRTVDTVSGTLNNIGTSWAIDSTSVQLVYFL